MPNAEQCKLVMNKEDYPLISVFTPVYNNARSVLPGIDALRRQTYPADKIQHLIVDDGSSDDSVEIIENYIKSTEYKCEFLQNGVNKGICPTYNMLLDDHAKGEFFIGLADDLWDEEKLETSLRELVAAGPDYAAVYSNMKMCDFDGTPLSGMFFDLERFNASSSRFSPPAGDVFKILLERNFITAPTILIRLSAMKKVNGFNPKLKFEDYDLYLRIFQTEKLLYSEKAQVTYRYHANNFHKNAGPMSEEWFRVYVKFMDYDVARKKALKYWLKVYSEDRVSALELANNTPFLNCSSGVRLMKLAQMRVPNWLLRGLVKII